jgi:diaminopimelate decarboxylase
MEYFSYIGNELYCEDTPVSNIIAEHGTPLYIYSKASILASVERFLGSFDSIDCTLCYSLKANSNLSILSLMAQRGVGADIVSGGELYMALTAGIAPEKIVYSGVGKTRDEIRYALKSSISLIVVESEPELDCIGAVAEELGTIASVALRINPDVDAHTHVYTTTAIKENKFGIPIGDAVRLYKKAADLSNVNPIGVDVHLGSPIQELDPYREALDKLSSLIEELRAQQIPIHVLDLGGGFGIVYNDEQPFSPVQFAQMVTPYLEKLDVGLIIEPGRAIVGNAGALLTQVTYVKRTPTKTFYICDAGMNDVIRPALYDAFHRIEPVVKRDSDTPVTVDIVGPICESSDFLGLQRTMAPVEQSEYCAVLGAGAYCFSMSSNYNGRPRAAEVMVDGSVYHCIRQREKYETLVDGQ